MIEKFADNPLKSLAWLGSSIGAVDLGLVVTDTFSTLPSEQLLGSGVGDLLVWGYVFAGGAALLGDLIRVID